MDLYKSVIFFTCLEYSFCGYTDYTLLLWLSSDEDMAPGAVWSNSSSSYNRGSPATINELMQNGTQGYRNTFIDRWSDNPPDKIRVAYRNRNGDILSRLKFNSTGSASTQWFTETQALQWTPQGTSHELTHSYTSYTVDFATSNGNWGAVRYKSASLRLANGTVIYIVGGAEILALLPATPTAAGDCYASYQNSNTFAVNITTTNQTHQFCSALCRERNYTQAGVHEETCFCLDQAVTGPTLTICTIPCDGNPEEMCGGTAPPAVIFNAVNTDIDVSQFDKPLIPRETIQVTGTGKISYPGPIHIYGFNISMLPSNVSTTIHMVLHYRIEPCNGTIIWNSTYETIFSVAAGEAVYSFEMEPLFVQCVYISLYDNATSETLSFPVNMTTITLPNYNFVTAQFLTIEAAWLTVEEQTESPPSDDCECDCWVYSLLYGESPFDNLSYEEIRTALKNVTEKLEKELTVNRTTLSSTIRRKTSAGDTRPSAAAVGYSLGVALLVGSLGAILLSDFPKMIESFSILGGNLKSRFGKQEYEVQPSDIADTDQN